MVGLMRILIGIVVLFFVLLGVKEFFPKNLKRKFCVLCFSVSLTWLYLLILFWNGNFLDKTILSLLIGMSSLGVFYLWEKKVSNEGKMFRLPLLLTLILIGYSLIEGINYGFMVFVFLGILWVLFGLVYAYRDGGKIGELVKKIVECCRNW
jgi:hypothetical protein